MALGSTQPLAEMSTRNIPGGKGRPARKADNLTAICEKISRKVGASASHNPMGLYGLLQGNLHFFTSLRMYNRFGAGFCEFLPRVFLCRVIFQWTVQHHWSLSTLNTGLWIAGFFDFVHRTVF
jgi:hypothetical protein